MKKKIKLLSFGSVYAMLTVLATIVLGCLKVFGSYPIGWVWVFAPVWGSFVAAMLLIGVCFTIVAIWGNEKLINGNYDDKN